MFQDCGPTLYLIRGLPGAGKSTFARRLAFSMGIKMFEADNLFTDPFTGNYNFDPKFLYQAHRICQENASCELAAGHSVIVSNTSTTEKEVGVYKRLAEVYNANFTSLIVENRHEGVNLHNVPEDKLNAMRQRFSTKL